jgi:hypothetical protein
MSDEPEKADLTRGQSDFVSDLHQPASVRSSDPANVD